MAPDRPALLQQSVIAGPLRDLNQLRSLGMLGPQDDEHTPLAVVIEINLRHARGTSAAADATTTRAIPEAMA
jgi:hypothetical protein